MSDVIPVIVFIFVMCFMMLLASQQEHKYNLEKIKVCKEVTDFKYCMGEK